MNKVQLNLYQLLCEIDDICKAQDVQYFLAGGTALGVVRNHRFLPWDDDMDLYITRDNWNKLRSALEMGKVQLPPNRELIYSENTQYYCNPIPRYVDTSTTAIYNSQMLPGRACGQHIEFLIMDPMPNGEMERASFLDDLRMYTELMSPYFVVNKNLTIEQFEEHCKKYNDIYEQAETEGWDCVLAKLEAKLHQCSEEDAELLCMRWGIQTLIYKHADYGNSRLEDFEGRKFPVGECAEGILRDAYGDSWMYVPDVGDQVIHDAMQDIEIPYEEYTSRYQPLINKKNMFEIYKINKYSNMQVFASRRRREKIATQAQALVIETQIREELEQNLDKIRRLYNDRDYSGVKNIYSNYSFYQMNSFARKYGVVYEISDECLYYIVMSYIQSGEYYLAQKYMNIRDLQDVPMSNEILHAQEIIDYCRKLSYSIYDFASVDDVKQLLEIDDEEMHSLLDYARAELWYFDQIADNANEWLEQKMRANRWLEKFENDGEILSFLAEAEYKLGNTSVAREFYDRAVHITRNGLLWEKANRSVGINRIDEEYMIRQ